MKTHALTATESLAALNTCLAAAPHHVERPKSDPELNWDAIRENTAEEATRWRRERPLGRDEWARREEAS